MMIAGPIQGELRGSPERTILIEAKAGMPWNEHRLGAESRPDGNAPKSALTPLVIRGRYSRNCMGTCRGADKEPRVKMIIAVLCPKAGSN